MVIRSREYDLIHELFYSTNPCNRLLAFELAKSVNCYKDIIEDIYEQLSEFPHFKLVAKANQSSYYFGVEADAQADPELEKRRASIEHFCELYFDKKMNLNGFNLSGITADYLKSFPKVLLKCGFVEDLDLSHNDLVELPPEISQLSKLRSLNLSNNDQLKTLPEALGTLYNLEHLDLSNAGALFQQKTKAGECHHPFPTVLRPLRQLRTLNLQGLKMDQLPDWIDEWTELECLYLYSGDEQLPELTLPATFTRLSKLRILTIDSFSVHLPENLNELDTLECLVINHAVFVPESTAQLSQLKYLDLSFFGKNYQLTTMKGKTVGDFEHIQDHLSRLELLGWKWLLDMTWLEAFVCRQDMPWSFTQEERQRIKDALPDCDLSFD